MKYYPLLALALVFIATVPSIAFAQADIQKLIGGVVGFINGSLIPFLIGITFFVLAYSAIRYFVIESNSEDGREKAKNLAYYSILAFVFVIIFWGIINLLTTSLGLDGCAQPESDYFLRHFTGAPPAPC